MKYIMIVNKLHANHTESPYMEETGNNLKKLLALARKNRPVIDCNGYSITIYNYDSNIIVEKYIKY